jgi:hypothetical protein
MTAPHMSADDRIALIRRKIERAEKHFLDLQEAIAAFLAADPYKVSTKKDPQTRKLIYYVSGVEPVPDSVSLIAGDVLHNLRSALDHLAQQLYLAGSGKSQTSWGVLFLIERNATKFEAKFGGKVQGMRKLAVNALRDLEPYDRGKGQDFFTLHTLNNIDKHRLLVAAGGSFRSMNIGAYMSAMMQKSFGDMFVVDDAYFMSGDNLCPLEVGDELFIDAPDAEPNKKLGFRFNVAFNEPGICEGKPVIEAIQGFLDLVNRTVEDFRPHLS